MTSSFVSIVRDAGVANFTVDRPARLNALTRGMPDQLENAACELEADEQMRVVILTGGGEKGILRRRGHQ